MAFKIVEDPFGQLTFMRIYQGTINKGEMYYNQRTGQKQRFSRIVKMHADKREEIDSAGAGDIVAVHGHRLRQRRYLRRGAASTARSKACSSPSRSSRWPSTPSSREGADKMSKALQRFRRKIPRSASAPTKKPAKP